MSGPFPVQVVEQSLYEARKKIYPRSVSGWFARWRWTLVIVTQLVFYGLAWLQWNGRQAVLFDLAARKFYLFGLVLWPQDIVYLTVLLILSALSLFLFTAVAGRLWCGYACPQTVYTEIFMWLEQKIEGDRMQRMKLDGKPRSLEKFVIKALKHTAWITLAVWTGYTFVGYFTPIRDLGIRTITWELGGWEAFWLAFYAFATYGNAGFMREQVCKHMCPYARFQSAMFDPDTLIITYDQARGEPRGSRAKQTDPRAAGLGDCVDCNICVQVCPTGIDIRQGLQYECIGCAACIDGCNTVMDKMGYPRGLIRYSTQNALANNWTWSQIMARVRRPRILVYTGIMVLIALAAATALALRVPVKMDVMRDRASLSREVDNGRIENVYRLQLMNTAEAPRRARLSAIGRDGTPLEVQIDAPVLEMPPLSTRMYMARVRAEPSSVRGSQSIEFVLESRPVADEASAPVVVREKSRFLFP
jgi:cytochrome c oxidase accessory protein FixG